MNRMTISIAVAMALVALGGCSSGSSGGGSGSSAYDYDSVPTTKAEHEKALTNLGVTIDTSNPTDASGNTVASDFNPLGSAYKTVNPLKEIFVGDFGYVSGKNAFILDDGVAAYVTKFSASGDDAWATALYKASCAADVDGDGRDEVVVIYYLPSDGKVYLIVYDCKGGVYSASTPLALSGVTFTPPGDGRFYHITPDLAACDVDGDGYDEILLGLNNFYILDDKAKSFTVLDEVDYSKTSVVTVTAGNYDADPQEEFAVANYDTANTYAGLGRLTIYDESLDKPFSDCTNQSLSATVGGSLITYAAFCMQSGDVDGDGYDEIVIDGIKQNSSDENTTVTVLDDAVAKFVITPTFTTTSEGGPWMCKGFVALLDFDGDNTKEIATVQGVYSFPDGASLGTLVTAAAVPGNEITVYGGDFDGDYKDDALLVIDGSDSRLSIHGLNSSGASIDKKDITGGGSRNLVIAQPADLDEDSPLLQFSGRELVYGDIEIIGVLCSPPYREGKGQADGQTSLGFSTTTGSSSTNSVGISNKFSIGYKGGTEIASASLSGSLETAFTYSHSTSHEVTQTFTYNCASGEDKVIFTATPYDIYKYKVVSGPDTAVIGSIVTINVPRKSQVETVPVAQFNAANEGYPDIDQSVLHHTIGDISTYPNLALSNTLLNGNTTRSNTTVSVGRGAGSTNIEIAVNDDNEDTFNVSVGLGLDFSFEGGSPTSKLICEDETTLSYENENTLSTGTGTIVSGTVGNLPAEASSDLEYYWGLFYYPCTITNSTVSETFLVVNYWIQMP
jgi:hypothetical protein